MTRAAAATVLSAALLLPSIAAGERVRPGETLVLHRGFDPRVASAMPGGQAHDGRLAYPLPEVAPSRLDAIGSAHARPRGPVVDQAGHLYVGTTTGLAILDVDGVVIAETAAGVLEAPPALMPGGDAIAISRNGMIVRVAPDGAVRARRSTDLGVRFAPLVLDDGSFFLVGANRTLSRFGPDLEERFRTELPDGFGLSPTLSASGRVVVTAGSELVVVGLDGGIARSIALPGRAVTPPARAPNGSLWLATTEGALIEIAHESRIRRVVPLGGRVPDGTTLAIAPNGDVLVAVPTRGVVAIDATGNERWTTAVDAPFFGFLAVDAAGRIAALDRIGRLWVITPEGTTLWSTTVGGVPLGPPVVTPAGQIVLSTDRGIAVLR